jgi:hypothetical protein
MPVPLGGFISEEVYDGKLRSEHEICAMECVAFVDAAKGQEEKCGTSWRVSGYVGCWLSTSSGLISVAFFAPRIKMKFKQLFILFIIITNTGTSASLHRMMHNEPLLRNN